MGLVPREMVGGSACLKEKGAPSVEEQVVIAPSVFRSFCSLQ